MSYWLSIKRATQNIQYKYKKAMKKRLNFLNDDDQISNSLPQRLSENFPNTFNTNI